MVVKILPPLTLTLNPLIKQLLYQFLRERIVYCWDLIPSVQSIWDLWSFSLLSVPMVPQHAEISHKHSVPPIGRSSNTKMVEKLSARLRAVPHSQTWNHATYDKHFWPFQYDGVHCTERRTALLWLQTRAKCCESAATDADRLLSPLELRRQIWALSVGRFNVLFTVPPRGG